jgi:hypothetical protein
MASECPRGGSGIWTLPFKLQKYIIKFRPKKLMEATIGGRASSWETDILPKKTIQDAEVSSSDASF